MAGGAAQQAQWSTWGCPRQPSPRVTWGPEDEEHWGNHPSALANTLQLLHHHTGPEDVNLLPVIPVTPPPPKPNGSLWRGSTLRTPTTPGFHHGLGRMGSGRLGLRGQTQCMHTETSPCTRLGAQWGLGHHCAAAALPVRHAPARVTVSSLVQDPGKPMAWGAGLQWLQLQATWDGDRASGAAYGYLMDIESLASDGMLLMSCCLAGQCQV